MADLRFEDAVKKLEQIVDALEGGELTLDASLAKYEEGIALARSCQAKLEAAKKKIEVLVKTKDGNYKLEPFEEEEKPKKKKKKTEDIAPENEDEGLF